MILNPNNWSPIIQFKYVRFLYVRLECALFLVLLVFYLFRAPIVTLPPLDRSLPAYLIEHLMHIPLPLTGIGINLGLKGALRDFFRFLLDNPLASATLIFLATLEQSQVALCVSTVLLLFELN